MKQNNKKERKISWIKIALIIFLFLVGVGGTVMGLSSLNKMGALEFHLALAEKKLCETEMNDLNASSITNTEGLVVLDCFSFSGEHIQIPLYGS